MDYNFKDIETKMKLKWKNLNINAKDDSKPNFYCLDMFPYPSGWITCWTLARICVSPMCYHDTKWLARLSMCYIQWMGCVWFAC